MSIEIVPYRPEHLDMLRALIAHPSLEYEFEWMRPPGELEEKLADPHLAPECTCLGMIDGAPAGFAMAFVVPLSAGGVWAAIRVGVAAPWRRRGLASRMLREAIEQLRRREVPGDIRELGFAAFLPNDAAEAFAARHGFTLARHFWLMERDPDPAPEVAWPAGIEARMFDGSPPAIEDWDGAYNASFAEHYHFVPSTVADLSERVRHPGFVADGVLLTYQGTSCVGFCRNSRLGSSGVVEVLGTVPAARRIGLGRAMLRWAVASFRSRGFARVELMVDGENEKALTLYRSEGFTIARTRRFWSRTPEWGAA